MSYAIRHDGQGYRAVTGPADIGPDEFWAESAPAVTQQQIRSRIWAQIKAERDRRTEEGGFLAAGKWFHSDQKSRSQQLGLVIMGASIPANLQWKTMDGTFVTMTAQLAGQILAAAAAADMALFATAESHKAALQAVADPAAYDYSTGWPPAFGD